MQRSTFLRICHVCTAIPKLISWITGEVVLGFVDGIIGWWVELKMALEDPIAFETAQRVKALEDAKSAARMRSTVNTHDTHP